MKSAARFLFPPLVLAMSIANAQTIPPQTFQHIIFVIQENRSPDSLFGGVPASDAKCGVEVPFEPGVDIVNGGYGTPPGQGRQQICNVSSSMNDGIDPNHRYESGWVPQYDNGNMDGFCQIYLNKHCVQYSFVQRSDVEPYFDIATAYGFANYMFQSNEGPSFPAHLFLFSGTSAPTAPFNSDYLDFVAGNSKGFETSGCSQSTFEPLWVNPTGTTRTGGIECYPHDTLVTNSAGDKGVSWRYYTPTAGVIWTAPASIPEVCYGENDLKQQGQPCSGPEWTNHVSLPNPNLQSDGAPILTDIANCDLQKISWVIPDEVWSDHPSFSNASPPYGPSWVANIVDAIGNSWSNSNHKCDYWGNNSNDTTAIFIVWDDWGGWFDHVLPPNVYRSKDPTMCPTSVQPNGWGCGNVYGFRVPLLVVSEYTKAGYVSGACTGHCPNSVFPYVHDFGSLLAFTEYNFGMPNIDQSGDNGYADLNAPDNVAPNVPLSDFFSLQDKRGFTNIAAPYPATLFENYYGNHAAYRPTGPDGGDSD
jgi:phospholipase C